MCIRDSLHRRDKVVAGARRGGGELFTEGLGLGGRLLVLDDLAQVHVEVGVGHLRIHPLELGGEGFDLVAHVGKRGLELDDVFELLRLGEDLEQRRLLLPQGIEMCIRDRI